MGAELEPLPPEVSGAQPPAASVRGASFLRLGGATDSGAEVVLSTEAYRLHFYAVSDSVVAGHPGEVDDEYLVGVRAAPAAVRELLAAGLWEQSGSAYLLHDDAALADALATYAAAGEIASVCLTGLGHVPEESNPQYCAVCHGPITDEAG